MWTRLTSRAFQWLAAVQRRSRGGASKDGGLPDAGRAGTGTSRVSGAALSAAPRMESPRARLRTSYASIPTIRLPYRGMPAVPSGDHAHPWLRIERLVRQVNQRARTDQSRRQLSPVIAKLRAERRRVREMGWFN
jgi:hypothetical protein